MPLMSVRENISLPSLPWLTKALGYIDLNEDSALCGEYIKKLDIKTPTGEQEIKNLSGGNQQKVCLAKWLVRKPDLIILDEPTRGIDVGAKKEIHRLIDDLTRQDIAVIMISSEMPEILGASDRIIVLHEGAVTAEYDNTTENITQEMLMASATGLNHADAV